MDTHGSGNSNGSRGEKLSKKMSTTGINKKASSKGYYSSKMSRGNLHHMVDLEIGTHVVIRDVRSVPEHNGVV